MRQSTVPVHDTFNAHSMDSEAGSEPALTRGNSVSQMENGQVSSLLPAKQPVERSASVAVGGMRRKNTINTSECSLYPPMGGLRPHLGLTRGEYTSITDDIESFSMSRFTRPRATSPLTHTFGPSLSFSRQSSAEYQTL
ncbi:hypothetical protein X975_08314, partial [Stegodyphus mimosarum]